MELSSQAAAVAQDPAPDANNNHHHDIHGIPPQFLQAKHWHYSSVKKSVLDLDEDVIDFRRGLSPHQKQILQEKDILPASTVQAACEAYKNAYLRSDETVQGVEDVRIYEHTEFPGKSYREMVHAEKLNNARSTYPARAIASRDTSALHIPDHAS